VINADGQVKNVIGIGVGRLKRKIHIELWKIGVVENPCAVGAYLSQRTERPMIDHQFDIIGDSRGEASFSLYFKNCILCDPIEDEEEDEANK